MGDFFVEKKRNEKKKAKKKLKDRKDKNPHPA